MNLFRTILCDSRLNFRDKCFMLLILEDCLVDCVRYYVDYFDVSEKTVYNALNNLFKCGYLLKGNYYVINADYIRKISK